MGGDGCTPQPQQACRGFSLPISNECTPVSHPNYIDGSYYNQFPAHPEISALPESYAQPRQQFPLTQLSHQQLPMQMTNPSKQQQQSIVPTQQQHRSCQENDFLYCTPQLPPSPPTMESMNSEANTPSSSFAQRQSVTSRPGEVSRPEDISSDAGTYSCTYHGCTQRFEMPAYLQKHKREAHQRNAAGTHGVGRGPAAALLDSQVGPHHCTRDNPTTGKRCNSVFSRPYDLTRHEDTIHNTQKRKVQCSLCTEKTFSRNDALTRHMRVVHPEVDWIGKQKARRRRD
ncbi:hypothetical protein AJ80_10047 [Polytolypa hystricis UAMH7299]|uniref:C2H2-type domain-containing protein n=1 Tax=Polytolypa hystricis (strain UAMH7299) TaxID=1447883 RepID=A0A2B7WES0_POLH7|nr:hypothetical protein AJ80_10047 [Polytolypa hystricis UAMH7299]